jgi:hypothetical protein
MAVKFSQFTTGATLADIDYFVGYKGTDNIQIAKSLLSGTTYTIDVPAATTNINLAGSDSTNDAITLTQGANMTLTRVSANEISFAATVPASDTYDLNATADGSNVDLNLTSGSGTDNSVVQFTAGTGITLTRTGAQEITFASAAGTTVVKDQFTGNNSTTAFTLSTTPSSADNINIYISGVYQNSLDSSGVANYSVAGTTLTFTTAPPTTAANGIEVVITQ